MKFVPLTVRFVAVACTALAAGCSVPHPLHRADYAPAMPAPVASAPGSGAIYQPVRSLTLFDDVKARFVGDTITIRLAERTQASKSASSTASKESSVETGFPVLLGKDITRNGDPLLNNEWESSQDFNGSGNSSQSNRLDGNITVTIHEVLPNGNLVVRGEKWLTLNQGEEFVQISGIVRPVDIATDNSVPSFKVADARITYSGRGALADANRPGLLARFFLKVWPL